MLYRSVFFISAFLATSVIAQAPRQHGLTVYWGQNSGRNQQRLKYYCEKDTVDIVVLAFVTGFTKLQVNFANMCGDTFSSGLLKCPQIGEDVKYCQSKGKIVLLSMGGERTENAIFENEKQAKDFAHLLYDTFGPGHAKERPLGDAVVNGFDLDMEAESTGFLALASELNNLHKNVKYPYLLTATPQCVYPDKALGEVLKKAHIHAVNIQFYNNPTCQLISEKFNFLSAWRNYADNVAMNKQTLLFIGLPGIERSAGQGYATIEEIKAKVGREILEYEKFGGFMLWDASSADANVNNKGQTFDRQLVEFMKNGG